MLSSPSGLLRAACLQSNSHPLHCKALELCFDVALNRLPNSTSSGPILSSHHYHHYHHPPSLSNALIAAFKRAQAHQRRESLESQQQPLLTVKIELEQLIISILDDPSVNRIMKEAGFSSTQVKINVEKAVSPSTQEARTEDVVSVIDLMEKGRTRSIVVVCESLDTAEGVVRGVMSKIEKEGKVQLITIPLESFKVMEREEVEFKVGELRCLVKSCCVGRGVVLYLGDLKWAVEYMLGRGGKGGSGYCPVEHVVMEIRSLGCGEEGGGRERLWLMGIATYETYTRCRIGDPSLEGLWGLQPLALPSGSLELSFNSVLQSQQHKKKRIGDGSSYFLVEDGVGDQLDYCEDCSVKFDAEACGQASFSRCSNGSITSSSSLPSWLQQYKEERNREEDRNDQVRIRNLQMKWNSVCPSSHQHQHYQHPSDITLHFSPSSPFSSFSSYHQPHSNLQQTHQPWPVSVRNQQPGREQDELPCTSPNPNPNPNSNSRSSSGTMHMENLHKFKELNAANLKILCNTLERKVPWQSEIIPEIASTILQCRSGMARRKEGSRLVGSKEETWLFFLGGDIHGKEKIGRELASLVFGSHTSFVSIGFDTLSSTISESTDEICNKMGRSQASHGWIERFGEAIRDNPHRVILMEDVEQVDCYSQLVVKAAIERGRIQGSNGEEVNICDAIVVLCCESFDSRSRACSPPMKQQSQSEEVKGEDCDKEMSSSISLDLNVSAGDDDMDCFSSNDVGLLESVDRAFFFKLPEN